MMIRVYIAISPYIQVLPEPVGTTMIFNNLSKDKALAAIIDWYSLCLYDSPSSLIDFDMSMISSRLTGCYELLIDYK